MDRDGTKNGFDLELTSRISDAVNVPVIASGGVGNLQHLVDGIVEGKADAVLAASIFHFGEHTVPEAKQYMAERGITVLCNYCRIRCLPCHDGTSFHHAGAGQHLLSSLEFGFTRQ